MRHSGLIFLLALGLLSAPFPVSGAESEQAGSPMAERLGRASQLMGKEILSPQGKRLGVVHDLVMGEDGNFTFLLLSRGSAFGLIGPFFPIPWDTAEARPVPEGVQVAVTEKILMDAPSFEVGELPESFGPELTRRIRDYYAGATRAGAPQEKVE